MQLRDQLRVMVVDDMSTSRALIMQALEWMQIKNVDYCADGETAFQRVAASPVHLVISDYNMPGADGLALLKGIRSYPSTKGIGFILVTGTATTEIIEKGKQLGMNNFIRKPFSPEQMKLCVERVVGAV